MPSRSVSAVGVNCGQRRLRGSWLWALLCLLLLAPEAIAQYQFDSWTAENGLPHNWLKGIRQTRDGYLWMTTGAGVVRFDGVRFKVFNQTNTPALSSHRFTYNTLWEDRTGALWMGTQDGGVIRYQDGVFSALTTAQGLPSNHIVRIDEDAAGTVWIITQQGLAKWRDGQLIKVAPAPASPFNDHLSTPQNLGSDGHYFGLWRVDATGWQRFAYGQWSSVPLPSRVTDPTQLRVKAIFEDARGQLWYGVHGAGDDYYRVSAGRLLSLPGFTGSQFICYQDRQERVWLTDQEGRTALWKDGQFTPLKGFSTFYIFQVFEDREGTIWISTFNQGLYRFREQIVTVYERPGGPQLNNIARLYQDRAGRVWAGSIGLAQLSAGRFENFYRAGRPRWNSGDTVTALYEDADGSLLISTYDGLVRFRQGRWQEEPELSRQIKGDVRALLRDRAGALWLGSLNGLYRVQGATVTRYGTADGLASDDVRALYEDKGGTLWIGTVDGLSRFDGQGFKSLTGADGLSSNRIITLYEDAERVLWIGTQDGGLNRLESNQTGTKITSYTTAQGLYDKDVFQILEDDHGFFWIGCQRGIYRVRKQELNDFAAGQLAFITATAFGKQDGMVSAACGIGGFKAADGRLWFPTAAGVAVIDPRRVPFNTTPPPVRIEECLLDGREVATRAGLELQPQQENLEIHYTGLSFIKPEQMRFKYKLAGLDRDWVEAGTRRVAYYSHVPPGDYLFKVIAANSDGVWNEQGQALRITVLPPFYRTWWFLTLLGLGVTGTLWLSYELRVRQLQRAQAAQQAFAQQLIASQEAERQRIAAELHDSLGQHLIIIKNWATLGLNFTEPTAPVREQLGEISTTALAALGEVRQIVHNLRPYQLDAIGLTNTIKFMLENVAAASGINFTIEVAPLDQLFAPDDEVTFYRVVQECVNNLVKHAQAATAQVLIEREGRTVRLTIADDGRGFSPESITPENKRGSFGLVGLQERVRMLGGAVTLRSAPGKGTHISIRVEVAEGGRLGQAKV